MKEIDPTPLLIASIEEAVRAADAAEVEQALRDADAAERVVADCVAADFDAAAHKLEHEEAVRVADKADFDFWVAAKVVTINALCTAHVRICLVAVFTVNSFDSGKT